MCRIPDVDLSLYKESIKNSRLLLLQDFATSVSGNPIAQCGLLNPQLPCKTYQRNTFLKLLMRQQPLSTWKCIFP